MRIRGVESGSPNPRWSVVLLAASLLGGCSRDSKEESTGKATAQALSTAGCPTLELERTAVVDGFRSARYMWRDSACRPRSAFMVHNDVEDPTGQWGGYLRRYTYEIDGVTRTCDGASELHPGFGYTVNHYDSTSNSSRKAPGTYRVAFVGRHHAIHEYRWTVDLGGRPVKATVQWFFATGKDHPVWAVTFDSSGLAANAVKADTRSPYGDMFYDGNVNAEVSGVMWGDRYRFESLNTPFTANSGWDYTVPNLVPFTLSWTSSPDAEMGSVQTQTWAQHDAGQGPFHSSWGTRSEAGPMPADWTWTYQLNQYELPFTQKSHRLAWGMNYGAVGNSSYTGYGGGTFSGYPYQSYSVFVALGRHSSRTVLSQVEQVEAFQDLKLTATVGQVITQGPAGVGRSDLITYNPVGYNPIYATWEARAASNKAQLGITLATKTVDSPMFVLRDYTAPVPPTRVLLNGVELRADLDYFASVDETADALWLTLARPLSGTSTLSIE